jgi:DNA-binding LacI/PurR family transcriptional regulator
MAKRSTAKEVAERAGVSRTTVSFVLNNVAGMRISDETRQAVLRAALDLDYHPDATARRMASGRTKMLGFVLNQNVDQALADHFLPHVLTGFSRAAAAMGYKVLFEPIPPEAAGSAYGQLVRERHVDGFALSGPRLDDAELLSAQVQNAPVVLLGQLPNSGLPFVDVDNQGGAAMATRHLIGLGHRRIGLITNAQPVYTASVDRLAGYRQALEAAELPFMPELVRYGNFTPQSGGQAMEELLELNPVPTAVFVASDTVALGALQCLRRHRRRIPDDIALVGFDDIPLVEFIDPPLTTVRLPAFGLGWGAGELLTRMIAGDEIQNSQVILETELIVRESCGASVARPPAQAPAGPTPERSGVISSGRFSDFLDIGTVSK